MSKRDYTKDYQGRPARVQLDYQSSVRKEETGTYNVWFAKFSMEGSKFNSQPISADYRCIVERDAGKTRASTKSVFCVHFSHGRCTRGPQCTFLHRIPMTGDRIETTIDCFGRDKYRTDREDMGGIGSFERRCKTLYIGNVGMNEYMEEIVRGHFGEFGQLEYVNVIPDKGVAFVQYRSILNAEFAKEAMQNQKLESDDIINVRWATEDPNPGVREAIKRKAEEDVIETIKAQLPIIGERGTILDYENEVQNIISTHGNKKSKKLIEGALYGEDEDAWSQYCEQYLAHYGVYPNTIVKETALKVQEPIKKVQVVAAYDSD